MYAIIDWDTGALLRDGARIKLWPDEDQAIDYIENYENDRQTVDMPGFPGLEFTTHCNAFQAIKIPRLVAVVFEDRWVEVQS